MNLYKVVFKSSSNKYALEDIFHHVEIGGLFVSSFPFAFVWAPFKIVYKTLSILKDPAQAAL